MARRIPRERWLGWMAVFLMAGLGFGCKPIAPGLWDTSGTDAELGAFAGTLEIRSGLNGGLEAVRLVRLLDRSHADGRTIELAWTGTVETGADGSAALRFSLTRADFVSRVGDVVRTNADRNPLNVTATVEESVGRGLTVRYSTQENPGFQIDEIGTFVGSPGADPIFSADRQVRVTHPAPPAFVKTALFDYFASYHALPAVTPWVSNPDFQKAVHDLVVERTDFDYYRVNPDRLRVVNKVVDAVSLAETEIRANAFRTLFHVKAEGFQDELTNRFLGPHGMVENRTSESAPEADGDGALWTGVYGYTQALRYEATGEAGVLDDLRSVVRGVQTLMDITGDPRNFARTLRLAGPPLTGGWVRGEGAFSHLDWLRGGNNDMAHGLLMGMIAGWEALPPDDPLRGEIAAHALRLPDLCEFAEERPPECPPRDGLDLPSSNPGVAKILAGITNNDALLVAQGVGLLRNPLLMDYARIGGGPVYLYGISDWSGNHLTLVGTICLQWVVDRTDDAELKDLWRNASGQAWKVLRTLDQPLHAALAAGLHVLPSPADEEEAASQAVWGLRSFPYPKHSYAVDHRIRGDYVLSPFPSLPWKLDWETNAGRMQSLTGHGLVESAIDHYAWNGSVFSIQDGPVGPGQVPSVDYLFLYWLARDLGLIGPSD